MLSNPRHRSALIVLLLAGPLFAAAASVAWTSSTAAADVAPDQRPKWDDTRKGTPLNLDGYRISFQDEFNTLRVTADGGAGPWFAPIHSPHGQAAIYDEPRPDGPFTVSKGVLRIRATKDGAGRWHSGNMQTVDARGQGFAQQYGYFEMRAKFPGEAAAWSAFWLLSQNGFLDKTASRVEIDAIEFYGADKPGHHASVHFWPAEKPRPGALTKHWYKSDYVKLEGMTEAFHTYGVLVTPKWVIVYFDRKELTRFPTQPEQRTPLYALVTLLINPAFLKETEPPVDMYVDYVRVYKAV